MNSRSEKGQTPYDYALACRNDIAEMLRPIDSPRSLPQRAISLSNQQPARSTVVSQSLTPISQSDPNSSPSSLRLSPRQNNQIHISDFETEEGIMNWLDRSGLVVYKQVCLRKAEPYMDYFIYPIRAEIH